jgi:chaperonin cofactor prefoldin
MSEQKNEMTREQYVNLSKIDSLAKQNARQAVMISELETQINLLNMELNELKQSQEDNSAEAPVFEPVEEAH